MNRKTRKGLGAILASVGVTTLLGVMSGTGVVRADVVEQCPSDDPETPEDESISTECPDGFDDAQSTAEVTMKERCIWYVSGVASSITLTTAADEVDEVYDGDQYSLSATLSDYVAWTSGNESGGGTDEEPDFDTHAFCTFFGEQTGIEVRGEWEDNEFDAEALTSPGEYTADTGMDFTSTDAEGDDPLTFGLTEGTCRATGLWAVGPSIVAASLSSLQPILDLAADAATVRPVDGALGNDKCNAEVVVTASIPAGKTPFHAGKPYKFTGPTFTTDISIDSVRS